MKNFVAAALAVALVSGPALADEFTDTLESALSAYRDGNVKDAGDDLAYATKLLGSMKSDTLAKLLPAALPGWTRAEGNDEDAGIGMAMLGGGTSAAATYSDGTNDVKITLLADSPMVSGLGAMITGVASMGGGKPIRIQRTEFSEHDGELQGVIDKKVMVSVSGSATLEQKTAYLEKLDFKAISAY
ncbi:MAG: hypothetical protein U1E34_09845 [Amaricoccus sp.]